MKHNNNNRPKINVNYFSFQNFQFKLTVHGHLPELVLFTHTLVLSTRIWLCYGYKSYFFPLYDYRFYFL